MRIIHHDVSGDETVIYFPERRADLADFEAFLSRGDRVLGLDTETTDLDVYTPGFRTRLVQFGNAREAWVLQADRFADAITRALRQPRGFVVHNAAFDLQVIDHTLGVRIEDLADRVLDTRIMAHLLDPRQPHEGGAGLSLKPLSEIYVDPRAVDTANGLTARFRELGLTKANGFAEIPIDDETFVRYAGLDVIYAHRLFHEIAPMVKDLELSNLSKFEHHLQSLLALMQRRGMRLDVGYVEHLREDLGHEAEEYRAVAARYGVENVNSTRQVAEALAGMGEELNERTASDQVKVDKAVLLPLADLDNGWQRIGAREPNPLADAVLRAKRSEKWQSTYAEAFLDLRDPGDRLHATIGSLQARTARMSVSRPPLQQLPAGDWKIRRAIVADPGHKIITADYEQIELRVLAALADVKEMKRAIVDGEDLHGFTATLVYGEDYTPFQRQLMKGVGFGRVYGGGAETLARQTGAPLEAVREAVAEYGRVYPEIKRYTRRLQERAEFGRKEVITPAGRHLPLDRDRLYSALNYVIQSTARDVLAQALVDMFDAGLGEYLLLPVHDEVVAQAPAREAEEVAAEIGRAMSGQFFGVPLAAAGEVVGKSWGAAYGADPEEGIW